MGMISYLITMFAGLFWLFRVVVAFTYSMGINFPITPISLTAEVILLFVTLFSLIFIIKRNIFGALVYFVAYGLYFGTYIYDAIANKSQDMFSMFIAIIAIIIAALTLIDILINKDRKGLTANKKSDWFYKNEKYERKYDDRVDKNQYKF
jgi:hypothetical protein